MADSQDLSGMWRCTYWYPSNERPGEQESSEYYCEGRQVGDKLTLESVAERPDHMVVNLTVDHGLATGTWVENSDPNGPFEGLEYSGAVQLLVKDGGKRLEGMWVGIGREKLANGSYEPRIYNGNWELARAGSNR